MSILDAHRELYNTKVRVTCKDGKMFEGIWSEWLDEEDNAWREEDNELPVSESMLLHCKECHVEVFIEDIEAIQAQP